MLDSDDINLETERGRAIDRFSLELHDLIRNHIANGVDADSVAFVCDLHSLRIKQLTIKNLFRDDQNFENNS